MKQRKRKESNHHPRVAMDPSETTAPAFHYKQQKKVLFGLFGGILAWLLLATPQMESSVASSPRLFQGIHLLHQDVSLNKSNKNESSLELDFMIAGFPKCGTTTLVQGLSNHSETSIGLRETCKIRYPRLENHQAIGYLNHALAELDPSKKRAIKCPAGLKSANGLERLMDHSPNTKLLIGVRHPVWYLQSFYNYRITALHVKNQTYQDIPPITSLVGDKEWMGVSTDNARFELFLMQLGKVNLTKSQLETLSGLPDMRVVKPNSFSVLIYSLGQVADKSHKRSATFRSDMQHFLGLEHAIPPFGHANENSHEAFPETVDICQDQYKELRSLLVRQGQVTQEWILRKFLKSPHVVVAGHRGHFAKHLSNWKRDPCDEHVESLY